ncbi:MAG: glycosyltransferase family 9 protein, partial [Candidatus Binataceae bacterium]
MAAAPSESRARVLIIFPGALGDLICLIPAMRAIATRHPQAAIELMARLELARFVAERIGLARAHSIDRAEVAELFVAGGRSSKGAAKFFGGFARIYAFFAADDARFRHALSAIAQAVSFHRFRPAGDDHVASGYLRAIEASGAQLEAALAATTDDRMAAAAHLERLGLQANKFILIFPGSGSQRKNWPVEKFAELAERRVGAMSGLVVLGPAEVELAGSFPDRRIATLTGLALGEVAGLAESARAFAGNDSGVAHLAAAAGAPGVVLFGPTDPRRWRPLGAVRVIHREPMRNIAVAEVAASLAEIIAIPRRGTAV